MAQPDPSTRHADGTPTRLGRYRLVRPLSTGGMAHVFEGRRDAIAGVAPRVAIKVILPDYAQDKGFQKLFINEARIGSVLHHQNIVQIQDFDFTDGRYYLVMEYVDGITLRRVINLCRKHGVHIPLGVIAEMGRQVCEGLYYAHTVQSDDGAPLGLVHRDLKPSNLMLNPQGVVKLLDFGISRVLAHDDNTIRGTWGYMAPEQTSQSEVTGSADLFGFASVLYELASLEPLFSETEPKQIRKLLSDDEAARRASRLSGAYGALVPILVRALQRDPEGRFDTGGQMGRALGSLVSDPVLAREQLTRFQEQMATLAQGQPPATAGWASPGQADGSQVALPVAAGDVGYEQAAQPTPPSQSRGWWPLVMVTGISFGLGVLLFLGFRAFTHSVRQDDPGAATQTQGAQPSRPRPVPDQRPPPTLTPEATPPNDPTPEPTPSVTAPTPAAKPQVAIAEPEASPEPVAKEPGIVTISSDPRSKVYLNGKYLRDAPLFRYKVPAGIHEVELIAMDGRTTSFQVEVPPDGEIRRVWSFDEGQFLTPQ